MRRLLWTTELLPKASKLVFASTEARTVLRALVALYCASFADPNNSFSRDMPVELTFWFAQSILSYIAFRMVGINFLYLCYFSS